MIHSLLRHSLLRQSRYARSLFTVRRPQPLQTLLLAALRRPQRLQTLLSAVFLHPRRMQGLLSAVYRRIQTLLSAVCRRMQTLRQRLAAVLLRMQPLQLRRPPLRGRRWSASSCSCCDRFPAARPRGAWSCATGLPRRGQRMPDWSRSSAARRRHDQARGDRAQDAAAARRAGRRLARDGRGALEDLRPLPPWQHRGSPGCRRAGRITRQGARAPRVL